MDLYIANTSRQRHDFIYRLPEESAPRTRPIRAGHQECILKGQNPAVVDAVISQHKPYGLLSEDETKRTKAAVGLCYSIDKPVSLDRIMRADEHNVDAAVRRAKEEREAAVVGMNATLAKEGGTGLKTRVSEIERPGQENSGFDEGLAIADGEAPRRTRARK